MNKNQKKLFKAKKNKQMQQFGDYPGLGLGIVWIIFVVDIDMLIKIPLWTESSTDNAPQPWT